MSFDGAPKLVQESREDTIKILKVGIEEAEASYDGESAGKLREELAALLASPSEEELAKKYDLLQTGDDLAKTADPTGPTQESKVSVESQDVASEQLARSTQLFAMQRAVRRGEALTKYELQELYFGRSYNTSNANDALEVIDLQAGNVGNKTPERNDELRRKANFQNLAIMFDCDNPSQQIVTDLNGLITKKYDLKVFVGEPTKGLVEYLDDNPEIAERVNFLVEPGAMRGGAVFPLEKITLEDMKSRLGLLSKLPSDHLR